MHFLWLTHLGVMSRWFRAAYATYLAACARQGTHETLEEAAARAARRNETAEEAKRRLEADSAKAREALRCSPETL